MNRAIIMLADGFEEMEALSCVDLLRRNDIKIDMVALGEKLEVRGSHDIVVKADFLFSDISLADYNCLITPGGLLGTENLLNATNFIKGLQDFYTREDTIIACICASPLLLEKAGIAKITVAQLILLV